MSTRVDGGGWRFERRRCSRDLQMLQLCSRRRIFWTNELAILGNVPTLDEAYRLLADLERRHLVRRVVCQEPISWRRTTLGDLIVTVSSVRRS